MCLNLYEKHATKAPSHTKFNDSYNAYLYLSARAAATQHLEIIRAWQDLLQSKGIGGDIEPIKRIKTNKAKDEIGMIGDKVDQARRLFQDDQR